MKKTRVIGKLILIAAVLSTGLFAFAACGGGTPYTPENPGGKIETPNNGGGTSDSATRYTVTYVLNGGANAAGNPTTYVSQSAAITLSSPTRTGYTFAGWTPSNTISAGSTGNKTFTANWAANTYYTAYDKNAADATGTMENSAHTYASERNLTANAFARAGYNFAGWNTRANGTGTNYADGQSVLNLTSVSGATVTLYARWEVTGLENFEYAINSGSATITGYLGNAPETLVIPEYIGGAPVKTVGAGNGSIFSGDSGDAVKTIVVSNGITSIGKYALLGCYNLTEITIPFVGAALNGTGNTHFGYIFGADGYSNNSSYVPASLKKVTVTGGNGIGGSAFSGCSGLTSITIPSGVTSIGASAFSGCSGLTEITLPFVGATLNGTSNTHFGYIFGASSSGNNSSYVPASLRTVNITGGNSIGGSAFYNCSGLTSITIPSSVTSIGGSAFYDCTGLTSITIPSGVTSIGSEAFRGCSGLTSITIPSSVTSIGASAFSGCSGIQSVTIPSGVMSIGASAFSGCSGIQSVTIPSGVMSIDTSAFYNCSGLTNITVASGNVVYKSDGNCLIKRSDNSLILGCNTSVIPSYVTSIGSYAFYGCNGLTSITIPSGVESIGSSAFSGCSGLTEITLPFVGATLNGTSNTHFGYIFGASSYGFNSSYVPASLRTVTITGSNSIGSFAFCYCNDIRSITIPSSVTSIGSHVFWASQTIYVQGRSSAPSGWSSGWEGGATIIWNA